MQPRGYSARWGPFGLGKPGARPKAHANSTRDDMRIGRGELGTIESAKSIW